MAAAPRTPRGVATRDRLLDAGTIEFAERGLAGARVERITAEAKANKAQLYEYFGGKDGLFDAVLAAAVERSVSATTFDASDLPGWAVQIYDQNVDYPDLARLITWTRLEQRPVGLWFDGDDYAEKLDAVGAEQKAGRIRDGDPLDLLALVLAVASAWSPASGVYATSAADATQNHERRHILLRDTVRRMIAPTGS